MTETFRSDRQKVADFLAMLDSNPLHDATKAQTETWLDNNVIADPSVKTALKVLAEYIILIDHALPYLIKKPKA